jgi:hypothetical protein
VTSSNKRVRPASGRACYMSFSLIPRWSARRPTPTTSSVKSRNQSRSQPEDSSFKLIPNLRRRTRTGTWSHLGDFTLRTRVFDTQHTVLLANSDLIARFTAEYPADQSESQPLLYFRKPRRIYRLRYPSASAQTWDIFLESTTCTI